MEAPISPFTETRGMLYFARMLDKIRKHAAGTLREDFHKNLGTALDGRCCQFLRVDYSAVVERTLQGGSDTEILDWCFENGRPLDETDIFIWSEYTRKIGWNDNRSEMLETYKAGSGLGHRDDLITMFAFMDADEGRDAISSCPRSASTPCK
ncbi:DUF5069 domain-containing protein [Coraliomargarita parva]|uniref:DUF5069 domain-containing protein n=1 Tax=Coraliomargarita parva TaxID=3014050 RepID=UPI0022B37CE7|nr:DUF5069 domain-containing protein [Coraliomargarita parva]